MTTAPLLSPRDFPLPQGRQNTHLCLHHGWPLRPQSLHCLEHVHHPLVAHPLQHDAERDEHACAPNPSTVQKEQEVPLGTCQPQRGSAELLGVVQASPAHRAQKPSQWGPERPEGHCQLEVSPQLRRAHQFCLASVPSCCGTLLCPRTLPRGYKSVPPGHWVNLVIWQKGCQWHPQMLLPPHPPACLLLAACRRVTEGRGVGSCQSKPGRGHVPGLMKAEAGADLFPLTCSAP